MLRQYSSYWIESSTWCPRRTVAMRIAGSSSTTKTHERPPGKKSFRILSSVPLTRGRLGNLFCLYFGSAVARPGPLGAMGMAAHGITVFGRAFVFSKRSDDPIPEKKVQYFSTGPPRRSSNHRASVTVYEQECVGRLCLGRVRLGDDEDGSWACGSWSSPADDRSRSPRKWFP